MQKGSILQAYVLVVSTSGCKLGFPGLGSLGFGRRGVWALPVGEDACGAEVLSLGISEPRMQGRRSESVREEC